MTIPPGTGHATTIGVEEEYLLLDDRTWLPAPRAAEVQAAADLEPVLGRDEVDNELLQAQVEVATPVCESLDEVAGHLHRFRQAVGAAADRVGCRLAASGAAPFASDEAVPVTEDPRYRAMRADAAQLVDEQLITGMHIHVAVPDRSAGAAALGRLRPWLPVMVALGANSPFWNGLDTGFASWRTVVFGRWPVSGSPPFVTGAEDYEERADALLATGVIRDRHQLYWHARLSEEYPTLEVRAPDVQLDVASALTLAGVARGLVVTALRETREGLPAADPAGSLVYAAGWHAARHGLTGDLVHPATGRPAPAAEVADTLLDHIGRALDELGDTDLVSTGVRRLLDEGTGAQRQRRTLQEGGVDALVDLIAPVCSSAGARRDAGVPTARSEQPIMASGMASDMVSDGSAAAGRGRGGDGRT